MEHLMILKKNFSKLVMILAVISALLIGCGSAPKEDEVAEAYLSYRAAVPMSSAVYLDEGSTTSGTVINTYTDVAEATYGYTFNGVISKAYDGTVYTFTGTLTLTGGNVSTLTLNYVSEGGVLTGTISGDETVIDVATLDVPAEE